MKMSKKVKKVVCSLALVGCLLGKGAIAYADTTDFTLTVTRSGERQDDVSRKVVKAGGSSYENKFYVRSTKFSGVGEIAVESVKSRDINFYSYPISLTHRNVNVTQSQGYRGSASYGEYYYLEGRFTGSNNSSTLYTQGRYTP